MEKELAYFKEKYHNLYRLCEAWQKNFKEYGFGASCQSIGFDKVEELLKKDALYDARYDFSEFMASVDFKMQELEKLVPKYLPFDCMLGWNGGSLSWLSAQVNNDKASVYLVSGLENFGSVDVGFGESALEVAAAEANVQTVKALIKFLKPKLSKETRQKMGDLAVKNVYFHSYMECVDNYDNQYFPQLEEFDKCLIALEKFCKVSYDKEFKNINCYAEKYLKQKGKKRIAQKEAKIIAKKINKDNGSKNQTIACVKKKKKIVL